MKQKNGEWVNAYQAP